MSEASEERERRKRRFWAVVRVLLALGGLAAIALMIRSAGEEQVLTLLLHAAPWLPLVALFELGRVGADALASALVLRDRARRLPAVRLFLAHWVAYAIMGTMPAGRPTAEATKAALLARELGGAPALAMGTANQANTLLSSGLFTVPCALGAHALGAELLAWACWAHTALMLASGLAIRAVQRSPSLGRWLGRRVPRLSGGAERYVEVSRENALFAPGPVLAMLLGRLFQAAAYASLAASVGISMSWARAFAVQGVNLVSSAVAVFVPGQLGASEGIFTMAADALGTTTTRALSIALLAHLVQLPLTAAGFLLLLTWRAREAPIEEEDQSIKSNNENNQINQLE